MFQRFEEAERRSEEDKIIGEEWEGATAGVGTHGHYFPIIPILVGEKLVKSSNEAKRLLAQGAIEVDGNTLTTATVQLHVGSLIRVGKRRFVRIVNADAAGG